MNKFGKITLIFFLLTCCSCIKKEPSSSSSFSSESESIYSSFDSKDNSSQSSLEEESSQDNASTSSIDTSSSNDNTSTTTSLDTSSDVSSSVSSDENSSNSSSEEQTSISSSESISSDISSEDSSSVTSSEESSSICSSEDVSSDITSEESSSPSLSDSSSSGPIKDEMNFITYISDGIYNEDEDNTQGVDSQDLSRLLDYFDNLGCSSYVVDSKNYLSSQAISKYNQLYEHEYTSNIRAIVSNNYRYYFNQEETINDAYIDYQNSIIKTTLIGNNLSERLNGFVDSSKISIYENNNSCKNYFFGLEDITPSYIDNYGPYQEEINSSLTIDYKGWTKVTENKYRCDRKEVIENLLSLISYNYQNDGLFLTYDYLTVEINVSEEIDLRIRVYVSSTQSGKLIASHANEECANWYLLAHEGIIYNVDNAYVNAIENFIYNED